MTTRTKAPKARTTSKQRSLHAYWYALQLQWEVNILATFRTANADQIAEGKRWYPEARARIAELIADSRLAVDASFTARITAVCAVLSPRITWQSNLEGVRRALKALWTGTSIAPTIAGTYHNKEKAWSIATGDAGLELVTGPKVSSFYANLMGDYQRVTIDIWAARAAGVPDTDVTHLDRRRYQYLERAYQTVSAQLGFSPAELQAICWIVVRGKGD